ncbi:CmpA/NrtA family ABC transporter substrate-binding protein [Nevskia sp.]|uniref:CmpA/NrtA family ABC transporter substrate-binding protein n=1 Tax=Nevskia sp. TaxID=1929292 RepID=UPI0025FD50F2|nr:CmpA/NrtA family ABC transporter substrate-binding protein [Nevskia sp.]
MTKLKLGLLPLADAAPLYVARECGYFAGQGLDVSLSVEASWAGLRDKLAAGMLDAAQLLAPMPLAAQLGIDRLGVPIETALTLTRNGNAITVSNALHAALGAPAPTAQATGSALKALLLRDRAEGRPLRTFAHVFPFSTHHYLLRDWLCSAGIDPDHDVRLVVVPPPLTLKALRDGRIDGYCVGAPWGYAAEHEGTGRRLLATHTIRPGCAEKVLGVSRDWAAAHPDAYLAMIAALIEAGRWLEQRGNRAAAAQMLIEARLIAAPEECVRAALRDDANDPLSPQFIFGAGETLSPHHDDARWFLAQMQRWGQTRSEVDIEDTIEASYRLATHSVASARATSVLSPRPQ